MAEHRPDVSLYPVSAAAACFLGLHILTAHRLTGALWGVHFLAYLPAWSMWAFALASLCLLVPPIRGRLIDCIGACGARTGVWAAGRRGLMARGGLIAAGLVLAVALKSAVPLLGDGDMLIRELAGAWSTPRIDRSPLVYTLLNLLHDVGSPLSLSPEGTYRLFSYASGVLYLGLLFSLCRTVGRNDTERTVLLGTLVTGGFVQLFFGYVENYAILLPGILLYILLGMRLLRGDGRPWPAAILVGVLIPLHFSTVTFLPSLFLLPYLSRDVGERGIRDLWRGALLSGLALAVAVGILLLLGQDFTSPSGRLKASPILPLSRSPGAAYHYSMLSLTHLLQLANQYLLTAPAFVVLACLGWLGRPGADRRQAFVLACSLFPVAATVVGNPTIGAFRDWDVAAFAAVPVTLWAGLTALDRVRDPGRLAHVGIVLCGAAGLHTALWLSTNADAAAAERRFSDQLAASPLAAHARSTGWETLGAHYFDRGDLRAAARAYEEGLKAEPDFAAGHYNLGNIYDSLGERARAIRAYRRAAALDPSFPEAQFNLGRALFEAGDFVGAIEAFKRAADLRPGWAEALDGAGDAWFGLGQFAQAADYYRIALAKDPGLVETAYRLGDAYYNLGEFDRSIRVYRETLTRQPDNPVAYSNIGNSLFALHRYLDAIAQYENAVSIAPDFTDAWYNLAAACVAAGENGKAAEAFRRVLELDPAHPDAATIRQWLAQNAD